MEVDSSNLGIEKLKLYLSSESSKLSSRPHLGQFILFSMTFLKTLTIVFLLHVLFKISESAHSRHSPILPLHVVHVKTKVCNHSIGRYSRYSLTSHVENYKLELSFHICRNNIRSFLLLPFFLFTQFINKPTLAILTQVEEFAVNDSNFHLCRILLRTYFSAPVTNLCVHISSLYPQIRSFLPRRRIFPQKK